MKYKCAYCNNRLYSGSSICIVGDPNVLVCESHARAWQDKEDGLLFNCPQCNTSGKVDSDKTEEYDRPLRPNESPLCSWDGCRGCGYCRGKIARDTRPIRITCPLCKGRGKLATQPEPVRKVVGWKLPSN